MYDNIHLKYDTVFMEKKISISRTASSNFCCSNVNFIYTYTTFSLFFYSWTLRFLPYLGSCKSRDEQRDASFSVNVFVFFRHIPWSRIVGSHGHSVFHFWGSSILFSIMALLLYILTNSAWGFHLFRILASICYSFNRHSDRCEGDVQVAPGDQAVHWHLTHVVVSVKQPGGWFWSPRVSGSVWWKDSWFTASGWVVTIFILKTLASIS